MALWFTLLLVGCTPPPEPIHIAPGPGLAVQPQFLDELTADDNAAILDSVLGGDTIWDFEVVLDTAAVQSLQVDPRTWVTGAFKWNGLTWTDVGVRLKGNGSFQNINQRPSIKVKFDHIDPEGDFFGQDVLVFNNMSTDPTKIRERVAYQFYRDFGVAAARANHATITIAGAPRGIYMVMEDVDRDMIQRWFDDDQGSLFELFDTDFIPEGVALFELEFGPDDRTLIAGAAEALTLPREEAIVAVEDWIAMEAFLDYYAVTGLVGQFDAYPFSIPGDDIHWYADPATQRLHPIPHGLDESFQREDRDVALPIGVLARACYFEDPCKERLTERYWTGHDHMQAMDLRGYAEQVMAQVEPVLLVDPFFFGQLAAIQHEQSLLLSFIDNREQRLLEDLGPHP